MNTQFNQSLAGTERTYVVGQGRVAGGTLHLQFKGENGNRVYGYSADVNVDEGTIQFFLGQVGNATSLQQNGKPYTLLQAAPGNSTIHFQVAGTNGNRGYGHSFDATNPALMEWLNKQLNSGNDENEGDEVKATAVAVQVTDDELTAEQLIAKIQDLLDELENLV